MPTALLVTTDLMATSTADGAAARVGISLQTVAPAAAAEAADNSTRFIAFDLTAKAIDLPGWIAAVRDAAPGATLLAYGPHVQEQRLQGARDSGFDLVVSRGQFHKQLTELLTRYASAEG